MRTVAVAAMLAAAGCGGIEITTGDDEISADEISSKAEEALAPKVSGDPTITCASPMSADDGASTTCEMSVGDDPKMYEVEATLSVSGDEYNLDFRSDDYHRPDSLGKIFADEVAREAEAGLGNKYGARPDITCPDDLAGKVGATTRCVLSVEGDDARYGMTAEVTQLDGSRYNLSFSVDEQPMGEADRRDET